MTTSREREINRQYFLECMLSMLAYAITLAGTIWAIGRVEVAWLKWVLAFLPVIPVLFTLRAILRYLAKIDEFQQRIQIQAIAFAAGATAIVTLTFGLLENAGFPQIQMIWVFPMIVGFWGIASVWLSWRNQ